MTAYLVESTDLKEDGSITGSTLRAYEIILEDNPNYKATTTYYTNYYTSRSNQKCTFVPTGVLYTLKDNKLIKKKTKATLANKYIHNLSKEEVIHDVTSTYAYGCRLFSTPEIALASKLAVINRLRSQMQTNIDKLQTTLDTSVAEHLKPLEYFAKKYPEYFI